MAGRIVNTSDYFGERDLSYYTTPERWLPKSISTSAAQTTLQWVNLSPEMATPMNIVKWQKPAPTPDVNSLILAYWLMYCRTPRKETPDADGFYDLSEIGADVEKSWSRLTPYSIARRNP